MILKRKRPFLYAQGRGDESVYACFKHGVAFVEY